MTATKTKLICSTISRTLDQLSLEIQNAFQKGADAVECRLDFLQDLTDCDKLIELLNSAPGNLIITCRAKREGGEFAGTENQRLEIITRASQASKVIAVDCEFDAIENLHVKNTVIASRHFFDAPPADLQKKFDQISKSDCQICKIAFASNSAADAIDALELARESHKPAVSLAMGFAGVLSRIAAKKARAWGSFASLDSEKSAAPGQLTIEQMRNDFRWDKISESTKLFGVIGAPVGHSMSPAIHNASFSQTDYDGVYCALEVPGNYESFARFMDKIRENSWLDFRGLSVTIPHKQNVIRYLGEKNCDKLTARIAAANTITIDSQTGKMSATNTDYAGALKALSDAMQIDQRELAGKRVSILGAGGVSRAIVAGLCDLGAHVTIFNRNISRAEALANEMQASFASIEKAQQTPADILINCTPVGMHPNANCCPIEKLPPEVSVVFDTIYNPLETLLLKRAQQANCKTVSGLEMFVNQAALQFETWTNLSAPKNLMREIVLSRLGG